MWNSLALCVVALLGSALGKELYFVNIHGTILWVGILGNPGFDTPANGGFSLWASAETSVTVADNWAGVVWVRNGCKFDDNGQGHCVVGDCGNKLECNGTAGAPPVSLIEFTLGNQDFYDVSLVDGYNIGAQIYPTTKTVDPNNQYVCGTAGCSANLNLYCPEQLKVYDDADRPLACKSSCLAFDTDEYCCRGAFDTPSTCNTSSWAVNSAAYFKAHCPDAYSYVYDDTTSTYTCTDTMYMIVFY